MSFFTFFLYDSKSSLNYLAASIFAGELILGSLSIEITDKMMLSAECIGSHLSPAFSSGLNLSSPGGCKIDMQTRPSGKTK